MGKKLPEMEMQNRFFDYVTGNSENPDTGKSKIYIYRQLVFYRFFETLKTTLPLFYEYLGEEQFRQIVRLFVKNTGSSPFASKVPFEFRKFILEKKPVAQGAAKDILLYETTELELILGNYSDLARHSPGWHDSLRISSNARLLRLFHAVHKKDFTNKRKFLLILYYDIFEHNVYYIESSEFMFSFIGQLKNGTAGFALQKVCNDFQVNLEDSRTILEPVLKSYCDKKILVPV